MNTINIYFSFKGRLSLKTFWIYWNIPLLILAGIVTLIELQGYNLHSEYWQIPNALIFWPFLAISSKRLHDINKSAWWLLLNLIPILGSTLIFLANSLIPGTSESNDFGPLESEENKM